MVYLFPLMFFLLFFFDTWKWALHFTELQIFVWIKFSHIQHQDIKITYEGDERRGYMWLQRDASSTVITCFVTCCVLLCAAEVDCWGHQKMRRTSLTPHSLLEQQPGYKCLLHTLLSLFLCQTLGSVLFLQLQTMLCVPSAGHISVLMTSRSLVKCNNQSLYHLCVQ